MSKPYDHTPMKYAVLLHMSINISTFLTVVISLDFANMYVTKLPCLVYTIKFFVRRCLLFVVNGYLTMIVCGGTELPDIMPVGLNLRFPRRRTNCYSLCQAVWLLSKRPNLPRAVPVADVINYSMVTVDFANRLLY